MCVDEFWANGCDVNSLLERCRVDDRGAGVSSQHYDVRAFCGGFGSIARQDMYRCFGRHPFGESVAMRFLPAVDPYLRDLAQSEDCLKLSFSLKPCADKRASKDG